MKVLASKWHLAIDGEAGEDEVEREVEEGEPPSMKLTCLFIFFRALLRAVKLYVTSSIFQLTLMVCTTRVSQSYLGFFFFSFCPIVFFSPT